MFDTGEDGTADASARPDEAVFRPPFTETRTVPPSPEVAQLHAVLAEVSAVDPVELPAAQALADTRELLALRARLDALLLRRLGDVETRKLHRLDASPTTTSWV